MTNTKSTKRALLASVMAMLLCFTMLLGTTFAWFTDEASTGRNIIQAGNLDLVVEHMGANYANFSYLEEIDADTKLFDGIRFEPGATKVEYIRVKNNGSLALKLNAMLDAVETPGKTLAGDDLKLSDHLKVALVEVTEPFANDRAAVQAAANSNAISLLDEYLLNDLVLHPAANADGYAWFSEKTYAIIVYMPETVGNEANHDGKNIPSIEIGLNVVATQYTFEADGFDNKYDEKAEYGFTKIKGTTWADVKTALEATDPVSVQLTQSYTLEAENIVTISSGNKKILDLNGQTITASNYQLFDVNGGELTIIDSTGNGKIVFSNLLDETGIVVENSGKLTIGKGVTVEGSATYNSIAAPKKEGAYGYVIEAKTNAVVNIEGGTFNLSNKALGIYADDNPTAVLGSDSYTTTINITGGTFNVTDSALAAMRAVNASVSNATVNITASEGKYAYAYFNCGATIFDRTGSYTVSEDTVVNLNGANAKQNTDVNNLSW